MRSYVSIKPFSSNLIDPVNATHSYSLNLFAMRYLALIQQMARLPNVKLCVMIQFDTYDHDHNDDDDGGAGAYVGTMDVCARVGTIKNSLGNLYTFYVRFMERVIRDDNLMVLCCCSVVSPNSGTLVSLLLLLCVRDIQWLWICSFFVLLAERLKPRWDETRAYMNVLETTWSHSVIDLLRE